MRSVLLILPFFGEFPNYFDLWIHSANMNKSIDFLIVTDNDSIDKYNLKENIKVKSLSFEEFTMQMCNAFHTRINIKKPYKLVDFKPTYAKLFCKEVKGYDFWGYIDADMILGDIRSFLTENILSNYERIFTRGHLTLYKNNEKMNNCYKIKHSYNDCFTFEDVLKYSSVCSYDEWGWLFGYGLSEILKRKGVNTFDEILFADIDPDSFKFKMVGRETESADYFIYKNGKLYGILDDEIIGEFIYIHLQKRCMKVEDIGIKKDFKIFPNVFMDISVGSNLNYLDCKLEKEYLKYRRKKKLESRIDKMNMDYFLMRFMMYKRKKGYVK